MSDEVIKAPKQRKDLKTAGKLLRELRQVDRSEHLKKLLRMFLEYKKDIKDATIKWKGKHDWDVNSPSDKLVKQFYSITDAFGADIQMEMDRTILPQIYREEYNQKQFWTSHFVAIDAQTAKRIWIDEALRTLPKFGKPVSEMTVSKKGSTTEHFLDAFLPPIPAEIEGKFKTLLFVEVNQKTFFNWLDRYFAEKIELAIGVGNTRKKESGVLDDIMFHVGQLAWLQPVKILNKELKKKIEKIDVADIQLREFEVGFDTVTEYKDLVIRVVVLDERTCMRCAPLDGLIFEESEAPTLIHHDCRCYNVPYFPGRMGVLEKGNYAPWFAKQDKEFQEAALGRRKYFLYDKGIPLRHLRGSWKDLSERFIETGVFSVTDIAAIDRFVRSNAVHASWLKQRLTRMKELQRKLKSVTSAKVKRALRDEIKGIKEAIEERNKSFEESVIGLEKALGNIDKTKVPGTIMFDEIAKAGVTPKEYLTKFDTLERAFKEVASKVKAASMGRKLAVSRKGMKDLNEFFRSLSKVDQSVLDRDYQVFKTAIANLT